MMKGIKKLFFGLSLMTIVGLAFHSEAKAATISGTYNGDASPSAVFNITGLDSAESADVEITGNKCAPVDLGTFTYDGASWTSSSLPSGYIISGSSASSIEITISAVGLHDIVDSIDTAVAGKYVSDSIEMSVTQSSGSDSSNDVEVSAVCPELDYSANVDAGITYNSIADWVLKGEEYTFTLSGTAIGNVHSTIYWNDNNEGKDADSKTFTSDGTTTVQKAEYRYDKITSVTLSKSFSKDIRVGSTSDGRYITGVTSAISPTTWTESSRVWEVICSDVSVTVVGNGTNSSDPFTVKPTAEGTYTLFISGEGLTAPGIDGSVEIGSFEARSVQGKDKITLSPLPPLHATVGDLQYYTVSVTEGIDRESLSVVKLTNQTFCNYDWDAGKNTLILNGQVKGSATIKITANDDGMEPAGSKVETDILTVYIDDKSSGPYYDLDPEEAKLRVNVGKTKKVDFSSLIYYYSGFDPEIDELNWIIPSEYNNIATIEYSGGIPYVKGLKKGEAKMYLKVKKGAAVFPESKDISKYYIPITVVDDKTGNPDYTLTGNTITVGVNKTAKMSFDDLVLDWDNFDPLEDDVTWVIPDAYDDIAKIDANGRNAMVKGLKKGTAKAYLRVVTSEGKKYPPSGTSVDKDHLVTIYVTDATPTPTGTPGKDLVVDDIDLTVGATDKLATFIKDKVSSGAYTVDGVSLATVGNNGGSLNNVTLKAGNKTGREIGVKVYDDANNETTTTLSVYPVCTATRDSSNVKFSVPGKANTGVAGSHITTTGAIIKATIGSTVLGKSGSSWSKDAVATESVSPGNANANDIELYTLSYPITDFLKGLSKEVLKASGGEKLTVTVSPYGTVYNSTSKAENTDVAASVDFAVYKISLGKEEGVTYKVDGTDVSDYFYAIEGVPYTITSTGKSGYVFDGWEGKESDTSTISNYKFTGSKTLRAIYKNNNSSSSSSSSSSKPGSSTPGSSTNTPSNRGGGNDYDDVPRTGESKADIWILWSVLLASILGAGYMIYKRFGLVNAIASVEVDEVSTNEAEVTQTQDADKAKEDNLKMLRDLKDFK